MERRTSTQTCGPRRRHQHEPQWHWNEQFQCDMECWTNSTNPTQMTEPTMYNKIWTVDGENKQNKRKQQSIRCSSCWRTWCVSTVVDVKPRRQLFMNLFEENTCSTCSQPTGQLQQPTTYANATTTKVQNIGGPDQSKNVTARNKTSSHCLTALELIKSHCISLSLARRNGGARNISKKNPFLAHQICSRCKVVGIRFHKISIGNAKILAIQ